VAISFSVFSADFLGLGGAGGGSGLDTVGAGFTFASFPNQFLILSNILFLSS
jgi:hypothetical protein